MKLKRLNFEIRSIITALTVLLVAVACNSDQQENKSTTGTNEKKAGETSGSNNSEQTPTPVKKTGKMTSKMMAVDEKSKIQMDKTGYYLRADVMPSYRRGKESLEDYITGNLEYPQEAIDNNVEGTVDIGFAVDDKGKISDVKVIGNKIGYGLEDEAIRVISEMPKWNPGQVKGKNVRTRVNLLITYKIEA